MENFVFLFAVFAILGWLACELDSPPSSLPSWSTAAGPLPPPPSPRLPRRIRRALSHSPSASPALSPAGPAFLSPNTASFATNHAVVTFPPHHGRDDHFLNEDEEIHFGLMHRVFDPVLGWRWRAYPKGTHEARMQYLCEKREGKKPVEQVEPEPNFPAVLTPLLSPPPAVAIPLRSPSPPAVHFPLPLLPTGPLLPFLAPASLPRPAVVKLLAAPLSRALSFVEQFVEKCQASRSVALPWPLLSFAEQFALSCKDSRGLPLPWPRSPPALVALSSCPPALAPAPTLAPPPARHVARRPVRRASVLPPSAPPPAPLPAQALAPTAALPPPIVVPAPAPLPPSIPIPIDQQNMLASDQHLLALNIADLGLSLDGLFKWSTTLQVAVLADDAKEEIAKRNPLAMARRYNNIAPNLKQAAIMLRLQVTRARYDPERKPNKELVVRIWGMLDKAIKAFKVFRDANAGDGYPHANFDRFEDALRFFQRYVGQTLHVEMRAFVGSAMDNPRKWDTMLAQSKRIAELVKKV